MLFPTPHKKKKKKQREGSLCLCRGLRAEYYPRKKKHADNCCQRRLYVVQRPWSVNSESTATTNGRLMQQRGGEAQERAQRTQRHLQRMESSPVREVRPRHRGEVGNSIAGTAAPTNMGHEVDRVPERGKVSDRSSMMQGTAPWRKRTRENTNSTCLTTSVRRTPPTTRAASSAPSTTEGRG